MNRIQKMSLSSSAERPDKPTIFYCGRLTERKGVRELLDSYEQILKYVDSNLVILGKGPLEDLILRKKKTIERTSKGGRLDYLGWQQTSTLLRKMREADVVVVPSYEEPFGIVILEAMCLKKPVIATAVGGITEILTNQVNGILIKPHNVTEIVKSITDLLENSEKSSYLGMNAFLTVQKKYSVEKIAPQFVNFMDSYD